MKIFYQLLLPVLLLGLSACQTTAKSTADKPCAPDYSALFDSVMQQERTWAGLHSKTIKLRGVKLAYSEGGPADGEVLVLLHGFTGDRNNWNRMAKYLTGQYRVLIPDLPGHGDTKVGPEPDYSLSEMSQLMKAFVDALGLERYHIAGNSMGGGLALQWAAFRPQQVVSLALIDSAGLYEHEGEVIQQMKQGNNQLLIRQVGDMHKMIDMAMADKPFLPRELLAVMEQRQIARYPTYQRIVDDLLDTQQRMSTATFHMALKSLRMPVLILWGEQDRIFETPVIKELERNIKRSTTVIMPGIGHVPIFEAPKDAAEIYRSFLAAP
ncbi:MAG: hypothetical protein CSA54_03345 [Gammaproteobacteria bacterium]|nr:MAG: hypothetical protein CSA54_03345 [Gammaproteobacteria bacterium]